MSDIQRIMRGIEDRKIEILLEIADVNDYYSGRLSRLNSEYTELDREYYMLRLELMRKRRG